MEELIGLVAVIGGLGLTAFIFGSIFNLIRARINRNNMDEEAFNRLARAFSKHKKDSERRIQNLEAIIAGDEAEPQLNSAPQSLQDDTATRSIEIEDAEPVKRKAETDGNNLRNMLRE
jgi:hypothetical protein